MRLKALTLSAICVVSRQRMLVLPFAIGALIIMPNAAWAHFIDGYLAQCSAITATSCTEFTTAGYGRQSIYYNNASAGNAVIGSHYSFSPSINLLAGRAVYDSPVGGNLLLVIPLAQPVIIPSAGDIGDPGSLKISFSALSSLQTSDSYSGSFASGSVVATTPDGSSVTAGVPLSILRGVLYSTSSGPGGTASNPGGSAGQIQVNLGGSAFAGVTLSGDATLNTFNGALTLASVGTAGTYGAVVTDAKGRVISGSVISPPANGGTGYGSLTAALDATFGNAQGDILYRGTSGWTTLAPGASGNLLQTNGASANPSWVVPPSGGPGGSGTVTSVNIAPPAGMSATGGPITASGSIALGFTTEAASYALIAPASGGTPVFRPITVNDVAPVYSAIAFASTITPNEAIAPVQSVILTGNATLACPTNMLAGDSYQLRVLQDATGGRTLVEPGCFRWGAGGTAPVLSVSPNAIDVLTYTSFDGVTAVATMLKGDGQITSVANGGTGAGTAAAALVSLGAYPAANPAGYTSFAPPGTTAQLLDGAGNPVSVGTNISLNATTHVLSAAGGNSTLPSASTVITPALAAGGAASPGAVYTLQVGKELTLGALTYIEVDLKWTNPGTGTGALSISGNSIAALANGSLPMQVSGFGVSASGAPYAIVDTSGNILLKVGSNAALSGDSLLTAASLSTQGEIALSGWIITN